MALDKNKPLGEQIDWVDMADKLSEAFNRCEAASRNSSTYENEIRAAAAMADLTRALETVVTRQEAELNRNQRIISKERTTP